MSMLLRTSVKNSVTPGQTPARGMALQRQCACGESAGLSGACKECGGKKLLQRRDAADAPVAVSPVVHEVLRSSGQPLDTGTRSFMESHFGHDFGKVRIHVDRPAADAADSVNAHAFTVGADVVFGWGQYVPGTQTSRRLLAHELAHVVQQGGRSSPSSTGLEVGQAGDQFEQEADRVAGDVMSGSRLPTVASVPVGLSPTRPSLQRSAKWVPRTPDEVVNPAEDIAANVIPESELYLGKTNFLLNGVSFTGASDKEMRDALHTPTVASAKRTTATSSGTGTAKGVDCWFDSVPANEGSYEMKLLRTSRWTHITEKKTLAGRYPTLKACKEGSGDVTFVLKGEPKDDDLRNSVKAHEKHHADDDKAVFDSVLVPWDKAVTKAHKDQTKGLGADVGSCEKVLYLTAIGHDQLPTNIVSNLSTAMNTSGVSFHNTGAGSKPTTKIEKVESGCDVVRARTG
jgi:hypothetical protein